MCQVNSKLREISPSALRNSQRVPSISRGSLTAAWVKASLMGSPLCEVNMGKIWGRGIQSRMWGSASTTYNEFLGSLSDFMPVQNVVRCTSPNCLVLWKVSVSIAMAYSSYGVKRTRDIIVTEKSLWDMTRALNRFLKRLMSSWFLIVLFVQRLTELISFSAHSQFSKQGRETTACSKLVVQKAAERWISDKCIKLSRNILDMDVPILRS